MKVIKVVDLLTSVMDADGSDASTDISTTIILTVGASLIIADGSTDIVDAVTDISTTIILIVGTTYRDRCRNH